MDTLLKGYVRLSRTKTPRVPTQPVITKEGPHQRYYPSLGPATPPKTSDAGLSFSLYPVLVHHARTVLTLLVTSSSQNLCPFF